MPAAQPSLTSPMSTHIQSFPRLLLALVLVFAPVCVVSYASVVSNYRSDEVPGFLVVTLLPVLFYLVAFLVCLPEALGLRTRADFTSLQRWSAVSRWTSVPVALAALLFWLIVVGYGAFFGGAGWHPSTGLELITLSVKLAIILGASLFAALLLMAMPLVTWELLAPYSQLDQLSGGQGWLSAVFTWNARCSRCFLKRFSDNTSLLLGSVATLASLILPMDLDSGLFQSAGYAVLIGKDTMPTVTYTVQTAIGHQLVARLEQVVYLLVLLTALVALISVVLRKRGAYLRQHRLLLFISGTVAVFSTTDLAFAYVRFAVSQSIFGGQTLAQSIMESFLVVLWFVVFSSSLAMCLKASRLPEGGAVRFRIAALILVLPAFLLALFFLPFSVVAYVGIVAIWIGSLFLYWGFRQVRQPVPTPEASLPSLG